MWESLARAAADDAGSPGALTGLESLAGRLLPVVGVRRSLCRAPGRAPGCRARRQRPTRAWADRCRCDWLSEAAAAMAAGAARPGPRSWGARRWPPAATSPIRPGRTRPDEPTPVPHHHRPHRGRTRHLPGLPDLRPARHRPAGPPGPVRGGAPPSSAGCMAPMTEVAAADPEHAWFPVARDAADDLSTSARPTGWWPPRTPSCMTAIMDVDMAAAVLLATEERADALGVPGRPAGLPAGERVRPRSPPPWPPGPTCGGRRPWPAAMRVRPRARLPSTRSATSTSTPASPAPSRSAATPSGSRPTASSRSPEGSPTTVARAATTPPMPWPPWPSALRRDPDSLGLVTGIGMHMTSHAAGLWSTRPGATRAGADHRRRDDLPTVPVAADADGPATVLTFSTIHSRQGPEWTALICDLPDGSRSYARLDEPPPDGRRPGRPDGHRDHR